MCKLIIKIPELGIIMKNTRKTPIHSRSFNMSTVIKWEEFFNSMWLIFSPKWDTLLQLISVAPRTLHMKVTQFKTQYSITTWHSPSSYTSMKVTQLKHINTNRMVNPFSINKQHSEYSTELYTAQHSTASTAWR